MARRQTGAVGYLRVSGQGQVEGHGWERQEAAILGFARGHGFELKRLYKEAHTGTEADRPAFTEMLADLLANGSRVVIVESLDRLARDLMVQTSLLGRLRAAGIALYSASTGEDVTAAIADDPMREALVLVQGVFAQVEKKLLVRKLRKAREAMRKRDGRCEGRKPYGPEVIARIRELRRKRPGVPRLSWEGVARSLNEAQIPTKSGKPWRSGTVYGIAQRERIA